MNKRAVSCLSKCLITVSIMMTVLLSGCSNPLQRSSTEQDHRQSHEASAAQIVRPRQLLQSLTDPVLKQALLSCQKKPLQPTKLSIAHRGAPLKYAEHTKESYQAAASMGAGLIECDATFTNDGELVCRHAQCDLHSTTNIISTPLNQKCTVPWNEKFPNPGAVKCCTSDLSLAEFKSLSGKMDHQNPVADSAKAFMDGSTDWRTDIINPNGTLMTHKESIALFDQLGVGFIPELKAPDRKARLQVEDVFGSTQAYAQKLIDDYKDAGIRSTRVWPQSFEPQSILYWLTAEPEFGRQAVMLDGRSAQQLEPQDPMTFSPTMNEMKALGVRIIAPPLWMLVTVDESGELVPSAYAIEAKTAGLKIITWSLERSHLAQGSRNSDGKLDWYYQFDKHPKHQVIRSEGDLFKLLDVLVKDVGVIGVFSDWPETVSYYANCFSSQGPK
jgi:glycerophosphoryl diester phosphodiesterase